MGLDIECECGKICFRAGSYSGFAEDRERLAKLCGITLSEMVGFGGTTEWTEDEQFYELLDHSDCDGILTPRQCSRLLFDFSDFLEKKHSYWNAETDEFFISWLDSWYKAVTHSANECCALKFH